MNFSKLLCLVLVYSEQFGQVLAAGTPECEGDSTNGKTVQCRGKTGEAVKLKVSGAVSEPVVWHKGPTTLDIDGIKLVKSGAKDAELTINTLAQADEAEYKAEKSSPEQKFNVQVVDCLGGITTPGLCKGRKGGSIKLGLSGGTGTTFSWKKGKTTIGAGQKYEGQVNKAILEIKNLDDEDEKEFMGGPSGSEDEKFSVQVAPVCQGDDTPCVGKVGRDLVLKVKGKADKDVTWTKNGKPVDKKCVKSGEKDSELTILNLVAADVGTYKATYGDNTESFAVSIPAGGGTKNNKEDNNSGGGSSSNNTSTDQVNFGDSKPKPEDGSGVGGLSYSPALLVTVTLVHLLLQLAA
ncbi:obscurin-like isoform X2 [Syngnathus typhle]|uniref:obscurin-like isoform X2 n=1 Tax=Syngnathus typhle TaxID=161592 RepID=UPI002A69B63F|nr:obscurin-like isoform X2 [Syngnathus typhle]